MQLYILKTSLLPCLLTQMFCTVSHPRANPQIYSDYSYRRNISKHSSHLVMSLNGLFKKRHQSIYLFCDLNPVIALYPKMTVLSFVSHNCSHSVKFIQKEDMKSRLRAVATSWFFCLLYFPPCYKSAHKHTHTFFSEMLFYESGHESVFQFTNHNFLYMSLNLIHTHNSISQTRHGVYFIL